MIMFNRFLEGNIINQILNNRGRLRHLYSWYLTRFMERRLLMVKDESWALPQSGLSAFSISLTSYKPRLNSLPLTILSLLNQSILPSKIYVWLTKEDFDLFDTDLKILFQKSIVEFCICKDYGPHKKWLPMTLLQKAPFIICDDDIYYPKNWYQSIVNEMQKKYYLASKCHKINFSSRGSILPYDLWKKNVASSDKPSHNLFAVGCGGAVIYPENIPNDYLDWERIAQFCSRADDIWLKLAHYSNNIPVKKSRYSFPCIEYVDSQSISLTQTNVNEGGNDRQLQDTLEGLNLSFNHLNTN